MLFEFAFGPQTLGWSVLIGLIFGLVCFSLVSWSGMILSGMVWPNLNLQKFFPNFRSTDRSTYCTNLLFVSESKQTLAKSMSLITNSGPRVNFTFSCISSTNMWNVNCHTCRLPFRLACPAPVTPAMPWTGFNVQRFLLRIHCSLTDLFRPYLLPFTCRSLD